MLSFLKRSVVIACALVLLLPCLMAILVGSTRILMWWSTQQPDRYYVSYPYLQDGIPWMIVGTAGIVGSATILSGRSKSNRWLWLPIVALLYFMLPPLHAQGGWFFHRAIHPMTGRPVEIAMERTLWDLNMITSELNEQAKSAGAFTCQAEKLDRGSPFASNGLSLDYELQCLPGDFDKKARVPVHPGTVAMSVSADGREAWFSVTSLRSEVGTSAVWLSRYGEIVSFHRSL
jgi:hypothetical protein